MAGRLLHHLLAAAPDHAEALHLAGVLAHRGGRTEEAIALIERALARGADPAVALRNLGEMCRLAGRMDEALAAGRRAVALAPDDPAALHNLAFIHARRLEHDAALAVAGRLLALAPDHAGAHFTRAEVLLLRGNWAEGWEEYEWRFRTAGAPPPIPPEHLRPVPGWDGQPLHHGRLLLVADQGFGDVIQFARYLPWAEAICPAPILAGSPEVMPVLRQVAPRATLITRWAELPPYAAHATLSGLPRLHGTRPDTVPAPIPYLRSDPGRRARWAARLAELVPPGLRRVGLVWAGRPTHRNDGERSVDLDDLAPLARLEGVALLALQKGARVKHAGRYFGRAPLLNLGAEIADYDDTMAVLDELDLLVTVDTSVAHLAGAMGRPTWIMLPTAPDWRWLLGRGDTPWYPTARLFRRGVGQHWAEVASDIAGAVAGTAPPREIPSFPSP